jgi:hydroxypyruvate isomerase
MPRFSANLGFLFADRTYPERVRAAAGAGFEAVEMHWPYEEASAEEIAHSVRAAGVAVLGINTPTGDTSAGEFGLGAIGGREAEFQDGVDRCLAYAAAIGATALHCMAGVVTEDVARAERTFVENLRTAAEKATAAGVTILIEPINHRDKPNYLVSRVEQAAGIVERVGRPNVKILFDCYHIQIMQGDLSRRLMAYLPLIGHVQIAGVPERGEPEEGEVHYPALMRLLDQAGYDSWVGAEYRPRGRTEDGLAWLRRWSDRTSP